MTLSGINRMIGESLRQGLPDSYWVVAEIFDLNETAQGHCYLELVEKDPDSERLIAKSRGIIWSYSYRMIKPYFETATKRSFSPGIKVLVRCEVSFHELYGLSLVISDIDPTYTLGDLALRRQEIIKKLQQAGIFDMNRQLPLPLVPQNLAVISSEQAAGLRDFIRHLEEDTRKYHINWKLFPATMQGDDTERTIISALESILDEEEDFDLVLIIRGGGSRADLEAFDQFRIAEHIAQFPLPVITGIGHDKDESVADLVARLSVKTPTAAAQFILDSFENFEQTITGIVSEIIEKSVASIQSQTETLHQYAYRLNIQSLLNISGTQQKLDNNKHRFREVTGKAIDLHKGQLSSKRNLIRTSTGKYLNKQQLVLSEERNRTKQGIQLYLTKELSKHKEYRRALEILDPLKTLQRGYSITRYNGKVVKNGTLLKKGEVIETHFYQGKRNSRIL